MSRSPASRRWARPAGVGLACAVGYKSSQSPTISVSRPAPYCGIDAKGFVAMSKKVADIIVETLQSAGVRHCYGVVGDTLNRIAHSISESAIEWAGMRHEDAGA